MSGYATTGAKGHDEDAANKARIKNIPSSHILKLVTHYLTPPDGPHKIPTGYLT